MSKGSVQWLCIPLRVFSLGFSNSVNDKAAGLSRVCGHVVGAGSDLIET